MFVPNAQLHARGEALRARGTLGSVLVTAHPDRDRRAVRANPDAPVATRDPGACAVGGGGGEAVRRPGWARDRAGRASACRGTDTLAAGGHAGARGRRDPVDVGLAVVRQGVAALGARAATVYAVTRTARPRARRKRRVPDEVVARGGRFRSMRTLPSPRRSVSRDRRVASPEEIAAPVSQLDRAESRSSRPRSSPLAVRSVPFSSVRSRSVGCRPDLELSVVESLARQAAQALDRAQLFEREQASADRLRKLQAVTAALSKPSAMR